MFNVTTQIFLHEFFVYNRVFACRAEREKMFCALSGILGLTKAETDALNEYIDGENVAEIFTENDYNRYMRIKQYGELTGNPQAVSDVESEMVSIKGEAIIAAEKSGMTAQIGAPESTVLNNVMFAAESGNITALKMLGVLRCAGINLPQDKREGIKNLNKAMMWGDAFAAVAALEYSPENKTEILNNLAASVKNTPYSFLLAAVEKRCGEKATEQKKEILLLRRAFAAGKINKEVYDPVYARMVFGEAIGVNDKERILFSLGKDQLSLACDLPLRLKPGVRFNAAPPAFTVLDRKNESEQILSALKNTEFYGIDGYKPLCVNCDSSYVSGLYADFVCEYFKNAAVQKIDIADLNAYDFEPTKNNVFVRSVNENKNNVFFLIFKGEISDAAMDAAKRFLKTAMRKKFRLNNPSVALDLSSVLPVCFCDDENAEKLEGFVETVKTEKVTAGEKAAAINDVINKKTKLYNAETVFFAADVLKKLCELEVEAAEAIIDKIIRNNVNCEKKTNVEYETIKSYFDKKRINGNGFGFGGAINE